jgi:hypothetical protein
MPGRGVGIPRLQELEFIEEALKGVVAGQNYDEIRQSLFGYMAYKRHLDAPSGNHAGTRGQQQDPATRYVHNTTEALSECMRLGFIERAALPSSKRAAENYRTQTFIVTPAGEAWAERATDDVTGAYTELLELLWNLHPQLAGYLRMLQRGPLVIPIANWTEVHDRPVGVDHAAPARKAFIDFLVARCSRAVKAGATGWRASEAEIAAAIDDYIAARIDFAHRRNRPHPYPRHADFVSACEEALVSFAFTQAGLTLGYISHEIIRRWTQVLGVANFSYHVPDAPALRLWASAQIDDVSGGLTVHRRGPAEWGDRVIDALPEAYERSRRRSPESSFVPIYLVRAGVCFRLGLNNNVFNVAVREFLASERRTDAGFRLNLDRAHIGAVPPTESALQVPDRSGRSHPYTVMTLVHRPERMTV